MPTPLLDAYARELPKISAEESLLFAERIAVGTGSLRKGEGKRIAHGWQRQAAQQRVVVRPKTPEAYAAHMAGLGISVKKVPKVVTDG